MSFLLLLVILALLLALGVPIAFGIGLATLATMLLSIDALPAVTTMAQRMASGLDSFALLAIPLFIISARCRVGLHSSTSSPAPCSARFPVPPSQPHRPWAVS